MDLHRYSESWKYNKIVGPGILSSLNPRSRWIQAFRRLVPRPASPLPLLLASGLGLAPGSGLAQPSLPFVSNVNCYICSPALLSPPPPTHTHIMSCAASITGPTLVQPQSSSARHWPCPAPTYC
ncbi:hypothetical protein ElyMa_006752500 [Elysia marginata]|uniref:Uncharacterized protein n=1 Tax=Elysia marginata TaxID=1093978 RepID=A0AAV4IYJ2_9GAST|nr:hypothetical protein ElyMa_006752500 [Elysia marginata]